MNGKPYSRDLRSRFVELLEAGLSASGAGRRLLVARSTATRQGLIWRTEKRCEALAMGGDRRSAALERHAAFILSLVEAKPDMFLREIVAELAAREISASEDAVSALLARHGVTRKKTCVASEREREDVAKARVEWRELMTTLDAGKLVFIDESGFDTKMTRLRGRSARGAPCIGSVPHGHWGNNSFIAGLRADRIDAPMLIPGAMNGSTFAAWVAQALAPTLSPSDIVICDNLSVHKNAAARQAIEERGAELRFLPAYSPDLNPIEMLFAKIKSLVRSAAARCFDTLCDAIGKALDAVSADECRNYVVHAGYEPT